MLLWVYDSIKHVQRLRRKLPFNGGDQIGSNGNISNKMLGIEGKKPSYK